MEPDGNLKGETNSRYTYFTTTDERASKINQFTLPASLNVLEKEYLRTTKEEAIKKIENKYNCSIAFSKLDDQDQYSIKVESQGNKDIIEGEISKLRKNISYQSTSFQSQYSKLGRLLLTSKSDDYNQHLQNIQELAKENQCLILHYKNKRLVLKNVINLLNQHDLYII